MRCRKARNSLLVATLEARNRHERFRLSSVSFSWPRAALRDHWLIAVASVRVAHPHVQGCQRGVIANQVFYNCSGFCAVKARTNCRRRRFKWCGCSRRRLCGDRWWWPIDFNGAGAVLGLSDGSNAREYICTMSPPAAALNRIVMSSAARAKATKSECSGNRRFRTAAPGQNGRWK